MTAPSDYNAGMSSGSPAPPAARARGPVAVLRLLSWGLAVLLLTDAIAQALVHLRDLSHVNHITGIWVTLAQSLHEGVFYPPVEQDGHYAGTRYVPVFFVLVSGLSEITADYVAAAKLAALLSVVSLLGVIFAVTRRVTGRGADGLVTTAVFLAFLEGRDALLSPHADALAVALSLGGLLLCARERAGKFTLVAAAVLFALAILTKVTSVAGPAAACVTLLVRDRRSGLLLAGLTAAFAAAGLLAVNSLSDSRFLDNLRAVNSGGELGGSLWTAPAALLNTLSQSAHYSLVVPVVIPAAAYTLAWHAMQWRFSTWDWYSLFAWVSAAVVLTVPGTDRNHLLELQVSAVIVLAAWLRPAEPVAITKAELVARGLMVAAILLALVRDVRAWAGGPRPDTVPSGVLAEELASEGPLLSEDATVPVLLGRRPVLLDPYSYRVLVERGRVDPNVLSGRVRRREFTALVLLRHLHDPNHPLNPAFNKLHFGPTVTDAIREEYQFEHRIGPYYVFRPRPQPHP